MRLYYTVHYVDESVLTGVTLADWSAMPATGILVVVEVFDRTYKLRRACQRHAGDDYYWMVTAPLDYLYRGNRFRYQAGDLGGSSARYIPPSDVVIKRGVQVDSVTWERIYNRALADVAVS
jgi:hypothetical protein